MIGLLCWVVVTVVAQPTSTLTDDTSLPITAQSSSSSSSTMALIVGESDAFLTRMETAVKQACAKVEALWKKPKDQLECGTIFNACEASKFPGTVCNSSYGRGDTCSCTGLRVSFDAEATLVAKVAQSSPNSMVSLWFAQFAVLFSSMLSRMLSKGLFFAVVV